VKAATTNCFLTKLNSTNWIGSYPFIDAARQHLSDSDSECLLLRIDSLDGAQLCSTSVAKWGHTSVRNCGTLKTSLIDSMQPIITFPFPTPATRSLRSFPNCPFQTQSAKQCSLFLAENDASWCILRLIPSLMHWVPPNMARLQVPERRIGFQTKKLNYC